MDSTRWTRRQLGLAAVAASPVLTAQQPATTPPAGDLEKARGEVKRAGDALRKVKLPQLLEPSFVFRP